MMVKLRDLMKDYSDVYLPKSLFDLEFEDLKYTKSSGKKQYTFKGETVNGKVKADYIIMVDLTGFNMGVVESLEPYISGEKDFDNEILDVAKEHLLSLTLENVALTLTITNNNFTHINEYNIYGGLIRQA